jgi:hypothetical protein
MSPSDFVNYARKKGCVLEMRGSENIHWLTAPKGGECFINNRYKKLFYTYVVRCCIDLHIDIISEKEYDTYE